MFGRMFFDFCQDSGYDSILRVLGATTKDFLQNLDALHDHLATVRCFELPRRYNY